MKEKRDRREKNETKVEVDKLEQLHRDALDSQGCSDSDLEAVAGGTFEVTI